MNEPEVALVFSPEAWVEGLHRHLTDHGGARVRQVVMEPTLALEEEYSTLIVSHRWPALTRPFVDAVHARRRRLLGVFDPAEPVGREHLLTMGVDRVIEADAPMGAFLEALIALAPVATPTPATEPLLSRLVGTPAPASTDDAPAGRVVAVGGPPGGGATEIAIEVARACGHDRQSVALIDADEVLPAVAQRLALSIEPNLRTAVDAVEYGMGELVSSFVRAPDGSFDVLCGLPNAASWSQVRPGEVLDVLEAVAAARSTVVVDLSNRLEDVAAGVGRGRYGITRAVVGSANALLVVGLGTPVGVTRLLGWIAEARALTDAPAHVVINRCPADGYRRAEIADEIERTFRRATLSFVSHDDRIDRAAWSGSLVGAGPFTRAVASLVATVLPSPPTTNGARSRLRRGRRRITTRAVGR
jgi:MinD-like ATPase involved in chromosome partitioning or flagellar assembly